MNPGHVGYHLIIPLSALFLLYFELWSHKVVMLQISRICFSLRLNRILLCKKKNMWHNSTTPSSVEEHPDCFHALAIVQRAAGKWLSIFLIGYQAL